MRKPPLRRALSWAIPLAVFSLASCTNQVKEVPFPFNDSVFPQPSTQPLVFGAPKKLNWLVVKTKDVNPVVRKLDFGRLPTVPFDTSGFTAIPSAPVTVPLNFSALPSFSLTPDKAPHIPLNLKRTLLPAPNFTNANMLVPKSGSTISISEIGLAQGLLEKAALCMLKDRDGFIWIGTDKALYKYDGELMQSYGSFPNGVSGMTLDKLGRIWYISTDRVGVIDPATGTDSYTNKIHTITTELPKMVVDRNGLIWIPLRRAIGSAVINPNDMTFQNLEELANTKTIFSVVEDSKNNIWLAGTNGLAIINSDRTAARSLSRMNGIGSDTIRAMTIDSKGQVWLAYANGLNAVDIAKGTIKKIENAEILDYFYTYKIAFDDQERLWMANNNGVCLINVEKNLYKKFTMDEGLPVDQILDVLHDDKHRTWLCSYSSSLLVMDQHGEMVHPVPAKALSTIMEDSEGKLWIGSGTNNGGTLILDKEKKTVRQLSRRYGLASDFIQNLSEVRGNMWIASNGGLDIVDTKHNTISHLDKKEGLASDTVYSTLDDSQGNFWISGPAEGIDRIDFTKKILFHAGTGQGLSEDNIIDLRQDNEGRIWIATFSKGVEWLDTKDSTLHNLSIGAGLTDTCQRLMMPDSSGRVWIGTDRGIYIADMKNGKLITITTKEGLSHDYITSLLPYKKSVVVGTRNKVTLITPPPDNPANAGDTLWKISILENSEGLIDNNNSNPNWNTNAITAKGEYIWGTNVGITILHEISDRTSSYNTYVTGLSVMNQPKVFTNPLSLKEKDTLWNGTQFAVNGAEAMAFGARNAGLDWDSVAGPYNMPVNLTIPHDKGYMQFQFAQLHGGRKEPTLYSYMLEGIDKQWSPVSTKRETENYLNLGPGNYVFKVRSQDLAGRWSKPATLSFTILRPWWQSWWMYLVYALALIGALVGYNKYRSVALVKENRLLEEKVQARTQEVKQQAEELTVVNQISQALVSQAELSDLIKLVGNQLRDLFNANIVYIALLDKKTRIIHFPYQYGDNMQPLKLGEGLTSKIITTGESLLINKDVTGQASTFGVGGIGIPAASYLGVPIPVSDEIIGVLSIQSTEQENRFVEKDKYLLATIAANVGVAIRKARLYEEVKQANTDADSARKIAEEANAAKSAFLSTVSHELRTPLTSVLGFAKITKKRLEEKIFPITDKSDPRTVKTIEQISGNLQVVISEGERLTNLINDVLDLAKIEAGKMEWNMESVSVTEVVERAIAATSSLFDQKNLRLERKIEQDLPEVSGDRDKLIQVVVNLLSNAVKFTNEGAVTCSVFQKEGSIVVGITDTGIGIAPEDHDKVFEQFKQVGDTLTDKPKGTGLGLPICKEILEHHAGKIWLESELGKGSTFYFMLPAIHTGEKTTTPMQLDDLLRQLKKRVEQSHPSIKNNHATILVVDDEEGIRSLLKQELGEVGYNIEEASNGKEAIQKIRANRPDLVILDVMMPEMNGFDVAAVLKNDPQTMEIPIIILSIVQDKSRGFRIGVDRYLTKPIDTALLFSEIGHLLEQGKSRKKVMVVDEDSVTVRSLTDVLQAKGYQVVESDGKELVEKAIANQPDIIILNSVISDKHEIVKTLRFEKGLENVLFLIYQ